jgi:4-hydroxy-tetrahydrodipicolinate reductase
MKFALIGYGAMGQMIARLANEQGHESTLMLTSRDAGRNLDEVVGELRACDVAVDFSVTAAVQKNIEACMLAGIPLVEGTTGWKVNPDELHRTVQTADGALVYGANFSVGVQVFYRIAASAAELFQNLDSYDAFIEEAHHKRKRDAPSGTAGQLEKLVAERFGREVPISSTRAGYIPGTHRLGFDSAADQVTLTHVARSREGFATGALMAAQWIIGRKGVYGFSQVFDEIITSRTGV